MQINNNLISTLEVAFLAEDRFKTMYNILSDLLAEGYDREGMIQELSEFAQFLDESDKEEDADLIKDLLDCFYGWYGNWEL